MTLVEEVDRILQELNEEQIGEYVKATIVADWLLDLRLTAQREQVAVGA